MKLKITALIIPVLGILNTNAQTYCTPSYMETCPTDFEDYHNMHSLIFKDGASSVMYSHLNTSCGITNTAGTYSDYSGSSSVSFEQGESYSIDINSESAYGNFYYTVWIDFNGDGDFDDAGEMVAQSTTGSMLSTWNIPFSIPPSAPDGIVTMRIRQAQNIQVTSPCSFMGTAGETHDYTVTIGAGTSVPVSIIAFNVMATSIGNEIVWNFAADNAIEKVVIEKSVNAIDWYEIMEIPAIAINGKHLDRDQTAGSSLYRLKIQSKNSQIIYSEVKSINPSTINLLIYPTIIKDVVHIENVKENAVIIISDINGNIQQKINYSPERKNNLFKLDVSQLPVGTFILSIQDHSANISQSVKLIKL